MFCPLKTRYIGYTKVNNMSEPRRGGGVYDKLNFYCYFFTIECHFRTFIGGLMNSTLNTIISYNRFRLQINKCSDRIIFNIHFLKAFLKFLRALSKPKLTEQLSKILLKHNFAFLICILCLRICLCFCLYCVCCIVFMFVLCFVL